MLKELLKKKNFRKSYFINKIWKSLIQHHFQNLKRFPKKELFVGQFKSRFKLNTHNNK